MQRGTTRGDLHLTRWHRPDHRAPPPVANGVPVLPCHSTILKSSPLMVGHHPRPFL
jgi:hypothetical protein